MSYIYVDGSCIDNGKDTASAGVGVYFGVDDKRNYSGKVAGAQDANRAELEAVRKALQLLGSYEEGNERSVFIRTDSHYVIDAVAKAKEADNQDANGDLIKEIVEMVASCGFEVVVEKVEDHGENLGNKMAHELAYSAAKN
ncbi:hypothetical protein IWW54_000804 [Coemansia sp. RSA 2705]|nr:hypothetical protein IWW54_000804 [Coemansia sp. RSA 2705]